MNHFEELRSNLIFLMNSRIGLSVDFFDMLAMMELEDGQYSVCVCGESGDAFGTDAQEHLFAQTEEAVNFFLTKREELKLGFDYEREIPAFRAAEKLKNRLVGVAEEFFDNNFQDEAVDLIALAEEAQKTKYDQYKRNP